MTTAQQFEQTAAPELADLPSVRIISDPSDEEATQLRELLTGRLVRAGFARAESDDVPPTGAIVILNENTLDSGVIDPDVADLDLRARTDPNFVLVPFLVPGISPAAVARSPLRALARYKTPNATTVEARAAQAVEILRPLLTPPEPSKVSAAPPDQTRDDDRVDHVEWISDSPEHIDRLQRRPLAKAVSARIRRMHDDRPHTSFLVHIDGRWGSGKSTLLNFIRDELEADPPWLVVNFDSWRQSRVGPPWWALLVALRETMAARAGRWARVRLWATELVTRARLGGALYFLVLVLLLGIIGGVAMLLGARDLRLDNVGAATKTVVATLTAIGALLAGIRSADRFLFWNSARGARVFQQADPNPMAHVAAHFAWLIERAGKPVVFMIDDLDRCDETYVVALLDAVQTLVRDVHDDPPAQRDRANEAAKGARARRERPGYGPYFIVAADGGWIRTSYERAYASFSPSVSEPGRPLGYLFLDKLFQLRVPVPTLSVQTRGAFFRTLLRSTGDGSGATNGTGSDGVPLAQEVAQLKEAVAGSHGEREVVAALRGASVEARQAAAPEAVAKLNEPRLERQREHELEKFAGLLDPNPRTIKRFLNAYSIARSVRTLEGSVVAADALALWAIIEMRWPALADHLRAHPDDVALIGDPTDADLPEGLLPLFAAPELVEVVRFADGGPLTAALVRECCGTHDAPPPAPATS